MTAKARTRWNELWSNIHLRMANRYYAERCLDLYGMLALDMDLTGFQQLHVHQLQSIIYRRQDDPQAEIEMTFDNIATDLENTFADAMRQNAQLERSAK